MGGDVHFFPAAEMKVAFGKPNARECKHSLHQRNAVGDAWHFLARVGKKVPKETPPKGRWPLVF